MTKKNYEHEQEILRRDAFQIPANLSPTGTRCIQVDIPDDDEYEAEFFAVLTLLTKWNSFIKDNARSARIVATIWRSAIWGTYRHCDGSPSILGTEVEDLMPLRVDCDCNVWVTCCDGTEKQILTSGQVQELVDGIPGAGSPVPQPGGGCQSYQLSLPGREQRIVPPVVNAGDTIQVSLMSGLWNDGTTVWYTPQGNHFFAGIVGGTGTDGADPLPASPHMALLVKIAGVFYDVSAGGVLTVPGGVSNALVIFQANDSSLSDNNGNIAFSVKVCNNVAADWIHVLDFTTAPHSDPTFDPNGMWVPGVGHQAVAVVSGDWPVRVQVLLPIQTHITGLSWQYSNPHSNTTDEAHLYNTYPTSVHDFVTDAAAGLALVNHIVPQQLFDCPNTNTIIFAIDTPAAYSTGTLEKVTIYGSGPEPVWP